MLLLIPLLPETMERPRVYKSSQLGSTSNLIPPQHYTPSHSFPSSLSSSLPPQPLVMVSTPSTLPPIINTINGGSDLGGVTPAGAAIDRIRQNGMGGIHEFLDAGRDRRHCPLGPQYRVWPCQCLNLKVHRQFPFQLPDCVVTKPNSAGAFQQSPDNVFLFNHHIPLH